MSISQWPIQLLNSLSNKLLAYDPANQLKLQGLNGKCLSLVLTSEDKATQLSAISIHFSDLGLEIKQNEEADLTLSGSISTWLSFITQNSKAEPRLSDYLAFSGDESLLEELEAIWHQKDFDTEALLSRLIGQHSSHAISGGLRALHQWHKATYHRFFENSRDYLRDELQSHATSPEYQHMKQQTLEIQLQTEQLEEKIKALIKA